MSVNQISKQKNGIKIAILGDSITGQNNSYNATTKSIGNMAEGYMTWVQYLSRHAVSFDIVGIGSNTFSDGNFGMGGYSIDDCFSRVGAIISKGYDWAVVHCGTNDLNPDNFTGYQGMVDGLKRIYDALSKAGIGIIAVPILPRSNWVNHSAPETVTQRNIQNAVNTWIKQQPAYYGRFFVADPTADMIDTTSAIGNPRNGLFPDGLHPSPACAYLMGKAIYNALSAFMPQTQTGVYFYSQADVYHVTENPTGNLIANGLMNGTSGGSGSGVTGVVANGWYLARSVGTNTNIVASKGSGHLNGVSSGAHQVIAVSCNGSGTGAEFVTFERNLNLGDISEGDIVYAGADISITDITGKPLSVELFLQFEGSSPTRYTVDHGRINDLAETYISDDVGYGHMKTQSIEVPAGVAVATMRLLIRMDAREAGGITVKIGNAYTRKKN